MIFIEKMDFVFYESINFIIIKNINIIISDYLIVRRINESLKRIIKSFSWISGFIIIIVIRYNDYILYRYNNSMICWNDWMILI